MLPPTLPMVALVAAIVAALLAQPDASQGARPSNRNGLRLKLIGDFDVPTFITGVPHDATRLVIVAERSA